MTKQMHGRTRRGGFTLVEISITMLVFGVGVIAILNLLPLGFRQASMSISDTRNAIFAENMFNALAAKASGITSPTDWNSLFTNKMQEVRLDDGANVVVGKEKTIDNYHGGNGDIGTVRYKLFLEKGDGGTCPPWRAVLYVSDQKYGSLNAITPFCMYIPYIGFVP